MWSLVSPGLQPGSFAVVAKEKKKNNNNNLSSNYFIFKKKKNPTPNLTLINPTGPWIHGWSNRSDCPGQVIRMLLGQWGKVSPCDL